MVWWNTSEFYYEIHSWPPTHIVYIHKEFIDAWILNLHYNDVIMGAMAYQITRLTIVFSTVYSDADQRKHQSSASLGLCAGNSPGTGEFPAQMASNAESDSIWWRQHGILSMRCMSCYVLMLIFMHKKSALTFGVRALIAVTRHRQFLYVITHPCAKLRLWQ